MSEQNSVVIDPTVTDATANGLAAATVTDSNGEPTGTTLSADQLNYLLGLAKKDADRLAKAEEAKEARKRANNRPIGTDGKEMSASAGFVTVAAQLIAEFARVYANDPAQFLVKVRDQVVPVMVTAGNTPSVLAAGAYDSNRRTLSAFMPPQGTKPVPAPQADTAPAPKAGK